MQAIVFTTVDLLCVLLVIILPTLPTGFAPVALSIKLTAPLLVMEQVTWPVAQNYCRENYIDLFTITNADDQAKLIEEMNKKSVIGPAWIGLYIELDNWYWSSYNHLPLKNTNLSIWHSGQPDNAYGADVCVAMYAAGYWWSYPCYYVGPFICYDGESICCFLGKHNFIFACQRMVLQILFTQIRFVLCKLVICSPCTVNSQKCLIKRKLFCFTNCRIFQVSMHCHC